MKDAKKKVDTRKRLSARVDPDFADEVHSFAKKTGQSLNAVLIDALKVLMDKQALNKELAKKRLENQILQNKFEASRELRASLRKEITALNSALTEAQLQAANSEKERDVFKAKFEEQVEALQNAEAEINAYQRRGLLGRLIGGKPHLT